jgi:hypothetical protein
MSAMRSQIVARSPSLGYMFWRVPTPPIRGSAKGILILASTSGSQITSLSTSTTISVVVISTPIASAGRLPGTSMSLISTSGYSLATAWLCLSVTSITAMMRSGLFTSQESIALRNSTGSSL